MCWKATSSLLDVFKMHDLRTISKEHLRKQVPGDLRHSRHASIRIPPHPILGKGIPGSHAPICAASHLSAGA
jgi:hypothetical protein